MNFMNFMLTSLIMSSHVSVFLLFVMLLVSFDWIFSRNFINFVNLKVLLPFPLNPRYFKLSHFLSRYFCCLFSPFPALTGTFSRPKFSKNESNLI